MWVICMWIAALMGPSSLAMGQPPPNDLCSMATPISQGLDMVGNLTNATYDGFDIPGSYLAGSTVAPYGVWYVVQGSGRRFVFSRGAVQQPRLFVSIFRGSCGATTLQHVTSFDPFAVVNAFDTENGIAYYILVYRARVFSGSMIFNWSTLNVPVSENDLCSQATLIQVGSNVTADLTRATSDENTVSDNCLHGNSQLIYGISLSGVWYKFQGIGGRVTAKANAGSYSLLSIFRGTCGALTCVAGLNQDAERDNMVTFHTDVGTMYYMMVHSKLLNTAFRVELVVSSTVRVNDVCSQAIPLAIGSSVKGDVTGSSYQTEGLAACSIRRGGLWYSFLGTGGRVMIASRCVGREELILGKVYIYRGSCGAFKQCVTGFSVSSCYLGMPSTFNTEAGVMYYMLVQQSAKRDFGEFDLSILSVPVVEDNDKCSNAKPVNIGYVVQGNFTLATSDETDVVPVECAGSSIIPTRGLWYSLQGTGGRVTADGCPSYPVPYIRFPVVVSVFTGACGPANLRRVEGTYFGCAFGFKTEAGAMYYILVQEDREIGLIGLFDLAISPNASDVHPNDICSTATSTSIGSTIVGNLSFATPDGNEVSGTCQETPGLADQQTKNGGVWYRFQGTGDGVNLTTSCPTFVHVYKGKCGPSTLQCVSGTGQGVDCVFSTTLNTTTSFSTEAGETYYLLVQNVIDGTERTTFRISLKAVPPAPFPQFAHIPLKRNGCDAPAPSAPIRTGSPMAKSPSAPIVSPVDGPKALPVGSPVATPAVPPLSTGIPITGIPPAVAPVAPVATGRCRISCRVRRLFRRIFGIK